MLKALFVLEIFTFPSWLFGYVEKRLGKETKIDLKIYDGGGGGGEGGERDIAQYFKK